MNVRCTQCGATIEPRADERLLTCPFCSTALVLDGSMTLFHELIEPTIGAAEATAHLRRFLGGGSTVADLDRKARLDEPRLELFPFWAFTIATGDGERVVLEPAAPSSLHGLQGLEVPAGATRPATGAGPPGGTLIEPEVPAETAREWLSTRFGESVAVRKTVLYHLPLYRTPYHFAGRAYMAAVDATSGKVFTADFPAKAESPFVLVAAVALVVFGIEGLVIGNLFLKALVYLVTAAPLLGLAWLTSRKV
ncbi:MAG: zinc ribbon domain-containing protein [Thermoanaerobaculales bacterium]|nr:zinc ribbon domain-containing protein [Thermoanaerobaculales bacterium]